MRSTRHLLMTLAAFLALGMLTVGCEDEPTVEEPPPLPEPVAEEYQAPDPTPPPTQLDEPRAVDDNTQQPELGAGQAPGAAPGQPSQLPPPGAPTAPGQAPQLDPPSQAGGAGSP